MSTASRSLTCSQPVSDNCRLGREPGARSELPRGAEAIEFYDADVEIHEAPQFPGPREYRGWAGSRLWFEQGNELFETFECEPQELIEAGSEVVVPVIASGRSRAGAEVEMPLVHVFTLKDAKIAVLRVFFTKAEALEAAGLSE